MLREESKPALLAVPQPDQRLGRETRMVQHHHEHLHHHLVQHINDIYLAAPMGLRGCFPDCHQK